MPQIEFVGQSAEDQDNRAANPSRLVNFYREPVVNGGRTNYVLKSVPGAYKVVSLPGVWFRAMEEIDGALYALNNSKAYKITVVPAGGDIGAIQELGATADDVEASISGNNGDVTFVIGGNFYLWNGSTLSAPTAGAFSSFGSVTYLANYTILSELGGRRFQWSALADASDLPGLSFSTADGRDDDILRVIGLNGLLYIFKEESHEIWYPTGLAGAAAFERQVGGVFDVGLKAYNLICEFDQGVFFVGDDGRAYIVSGGVQPVSFPAVETAIKDSDPQYCVTYDDEGHTFCAIICGDAPAWVYDLATGEWHERAQGADLDPWEATVSARVGGRWYVGRNGGDLLRLARANSDGGLTLKRKAVSRTLYLDGKRQILKELEVFARQGFDDASVMLRLSRDNGMTWTAPKVRSWAVGEYAKRIIWRALGQFRQATAEVTITDAVECSINAEARVRL